MDLNLRIFCLMIEKERIYSKSSADTIRNSPFCPFLWDIERTGSFFKESVLLNNSFSVYFRGEIFKTGLKPPPIFDQVRLSTCLCGRSSADLLRVLFFNLQRLQKTLNLCINSNLHCKWANIIILQKNRQKELRFFVELAQKSRGSRFAVFTESCQH